MVDNVENPWWITHAAIVNNGDGTPILTHGKRVFTRKILQEFLPDNPVISRRFLEETGVFLFRRV